MNQYKGLFTYDVDNHRYVPVEQADGLISDMNYNPEPKEEPKGIQDVYNVKDYVYIKMSSEEEAEKAVEKLKAWKSLRDKGFQFESWFGGSNDISFWLDTEIDEDIEKDLDILFGGEE